jgi:hypothetical protein
VVGFFAWSVDDEGEAFDEGTDGVFGVADFILTPDGESAGSNAGVGT